MTDFVKRDFVSRLREYVPADFHASTPYTLSRGRPEPRSAALLRRLIGNSGVTRHGNINPLCIGYGFRPRLSSRLTLGGRAFPRKPWAYGGKDSHLALATHARILTPVLSTGTSVFCFILYRTLPYRSATCVAEPIASVPCLAPCIVGACPLDQ